MKIFHILAGLLSLIAGATALYAVKGGRLHRRSGMVFAGAMLAMSATGATMAAFVVQSRISVIAGLLTFYLVCTGVLSVRREFDQSRGPLFAFLLMGLMIAIAGFGLSVDSLNSIDGKIDGLPVQPLLLFSTLALLGAIGDARLLRVRTLPPPRRISRHLWRMCFAMWMATTSFFLGQAKLFPVAVRKSGVLAIPVVLVLLLLIYWFIRTRFFPPARRVPVPAPNAENRADAGNFADRRSPG